jgi:glutathione S-transferase
MLKIYGSDLSSPSNKVRFTANYLGIPYEYIKINLRAGEHQAPEFLKINPAGKIPAMDDGGFILWESGAICKYLANKQKSDLYPGEFKERAIVDQWLDFSTLHVGMAVSRVLYNRVFAAMRKEEVDERSIKENLKFLERFFPVVDQQLGKNAYLTGNKWTLADITLLAGLDPIEIAHIDISSYKNIVKWRNGLKQKDFYTKCYKEYGEALKQAASR